MQLTADRRSEILRRHAEWERQVKEMSDARLEAFPEILGRLRVEESSDLVNAKHADAMTRDADKALKNMEAFVRKLISGSEDGRTTHEEKVVLLENVVSKVKQRFEDGASVMTGQVVAWLENAQRKELDEIERLVMDVRDLGTTAQGDLGLGYAWLDDVTIQDWARYHGLLDAATDLQAKLTNLASGSDPASPKNVLSEAMRDLQLDLETVVLRFRSDLSAVHQRGLEAIHRGNLSGANPHHTTITSGEPTMSILPINDGPADQVVDPQSVVLGKSREQVEEAVAWEMANEARAHAEL
ncbi:hypothetical protein FRB93_012113 [Tulasnella sp. JGI-2019a]|nr:hypothetical protein FRB93_012113 [Tulasnella sp. JGI-2019a]